MYELKELPNGFEYIEITNAKASAKIALQGAHIYEYKRQDKRDILWLSESSAFENRVAIRGGIPICWPRFGVLDKSMPAHGFSRTSLFHLKNVKELDTDTTQITLALKDSPASRQIWDYKFELEVAFKIGETLEVSITTYNCDSKEFMITQALHTYFSVSEINDVTIFGLENREFIDTLCDEKKLEKAPIKIDAECDRVYLKSHKEIDLEDKNQTIKIHSKGSNSTVVWNPWIEKGSRMSGMKADAYREFVCIETANAFDDFRVIKSGKSHSLSLLLRE
jgi:glucose-6-phosphate 1-epimerase